MNVADRAAEDASGLLDRAFQTVKLLNLDVEQPDHLGSSREWRVLERKQVRISWLLPIGKKQIEILTFNFRDLYFGDSIPGEFQMITPQHASHKRKEPARANLAGLNIFIKAELQSDCFSWRVKLIHRR